jgi:hypothetical protein
MRILQNLIFIHRTVDWGKCHPEYFEALCASKSNLPSSSSSMLSKGSMIFPIFKKQEISQVKKDTAPITKEIPLFLIRAIANKNPIGLMAKASARTKKVELTLILC